MSEKLQQIVDKVFLVDPNGLTPEEVGQFDTWERQHHFRMMYGWEDAINEGSKLSYREYSIIQWKKTLPKIIWPIHVN